MTEFAISVAKKLVDLSDDGEATVQVLEPADEVPAVKSREEREAQPRRTAGDR